MTLINSKLRVAWKNTNIHQNPMKMWTEVRPLATQKADKLEKSFEYLLEIN